MRIEGAWCEMSDWETVKGKIDAALAARGWSRSGGVWAKTLGAEDVPDPSRYIGYWPLREILAGDKVFGIGASGVANFISETYVTAIEEDISDFAELDADDETWMWDGGGYDEHVSGYVQSCLQPDLDVDYIADWIKQTVGDVEGGIRHGA